MKQTDMEKSISPNQSCQINLVKSILAKSFQDPGNLARLTNVGKRGLHSAGTHSVEVSVELVVAS